MLNTGDILVGNGREFYLVTRRQFPSAMPSMEAARALAEAGKAQKLNREGLEALTKNLSKFPLLG